MPFSPYLALGAVLGLLVAAIGGYAYGQHHQALVDQVAINRQKAEAALTLATETDKVRATEAKNADLAAQLEKTHADADAAVASANDNLRDSMAQWVRAHPGCRQDRGGPDGRAQSAAVAQEPAAGSDERLPSGSGAFIRACAAAANTLAAYARECHGWAIAAHC